MENDEYSKSLTIELLKEYSLKILKIFLFEKTFGY